MVELFIECLGRYFELKEAICKACAGKRSTNLANYWRFKHYIACGNERTTKGKHSSLFIGSAGTRVCKRVKESLETLKRIVGCVEQGGACQSCSLLSSLFS